MSNMIFANVQGLEGRTHYQQQTTLSTINQLTSFVNKQTIIGDKQTSAAKHSFMKEGKKSAEKENLPLTSVDMDLFVRNDGG